MSDWQSLGLSPESTEVLINAGFAAPTDVQVAAIPSALAGGDLLVSARTGSGKTATFALPIIEKLAGRKGTLALILAPTREIAQQTHATFERLGKPRGVHSAVLIGGVDYRADMTALATRPQVLVATPGRLCDHIERGNLWLEFIEVAVLDEADRMLDMGFANELGRIMKELGPDRQTLLYSATMPASVEKLARQYLKNDAKRIAVGTVSKPASSVKQKLIWLKEDHKRSRLIRLLEEEKGTVIIFVRTKDGATDLFRALQRRSFYDVTAMHSNLEQRHREQALAAFKEGRARVLIATDVVGRGIHVENVAHVVNWDVPLEPEDYVHRIGRTGRIDVTGQVAEGCATTFATPRERDLINAIEGIIGHEAITVEFADEAVRDILVNGKPDEKRSSSGGAGGAKSSTGRRPPARRR